MDQKRLAAGMDIGSNTVRLLLVEVEPDSIKGVRRVQAITRLGGGFEPGKGLSRQAMERTVRGIAAMVADLGAEGLPPTIAVGTSALRRAADRERFIEMVREATGIEVEVIDGGLEAELTCRGVRSASDLSEFWLLDVGAGSTELGFCGEGGCVAMSVELGCITLLDRALGADPPTKADLEAGRAIADEAMRGIIQELKAADRAAGAELVAVAGTATTLAAMDLGLSEYDAEKVQGHVLKLGRLREMLDQLVSMPAAERAGIPGIEPGREDLIVPGIIIILAAMKALRRSALVVSDASLLEGAALLAADRFHGPADRVFVRRDRLTILGPFR